MAYRNRRYATDAIRDPLRRVPERALLLPKARPGDRFDVATERDLLRRAKAGDKSAADELVLRFVGLAKTMSLRVRRPAGLEYGDLDQLACMALLDAVRLYDPVRHAGIRFSTFAGWQIRQQIWRAGRKSQERLPASEDNEKDLAGLLAAGLGPPEAAELSELSGRLRAAMGWLNWNQRRVLEGRFFEYLTLAELAKELRMTKERVRQIEMRAIQRLRIIMAEGGA